MGAYTDIQIWFELRAAKPSHLAVAWEKFKDSYWFPTTNWDSMSIDENNLDPPHDVVAFTTWLNNIFVEELKDECPVAGTWDGIMPPFESNAWQNSGSRHETDGRQIQYALVGNVGYPNEFQFDYELRSRNTVRTYRASVYVAASYIPPPRLLSSRQADSVSEGKPYTKLFDTQLVAPEDLSGLDRILLTFYWTRTIYGKGRLLIGDDEIDQPSTLHGESDEDLQVSLQLPINVGDYAGNKMRVLVPYAGEPPELLDVQWLGHKIVEKAIDTRARRRSWIACRSQSAQSAAQRFFLALDLETNFTLFFDWPNRQNAERCRLLERVTDGLADRLYHRARSRADQEDAIPDTASYADDLAAISDLMQKLIAQHLGPEPEATETAFDNFAAGWLRQHCRIGVDALRATMTCDADSAQMFLFAEMVLAVLDTSRKNHDKEWVERTAFWRPRLNAFVRMQKIYLKRWKVLTCDCSQCECCIELYKQMKDFIDPKCFDSYGGAIPPLHGNYSSLIKPFRALQPASAGREERGREEDLEEHELRKRMVAHLRDAGADRPGCFGGRATPAVNR